MRTKSEFLKNAAAWLLLFIVLVISPLFLAVIGHEHESRGFWTEFGVGLGFVGLAMMGLQFVLTARYSKIGAPFGLDELLHFHAQAGYLAWLFILGHFVVLFVADSEFHAFLDPTVNLPRAVALGAVLIAITALIASTHWREKLGVVYEWWRATHGLLAVFVVFVGTVHILQVSFYVSELWQQMIWVGLSVVAIGMLLHNRVWRPLQMKKKPYKVIDVYKEVEGIWSVELEPEGHDGLSFEAGQFIWITFGDTPFSLQQHPFTISSSPGIDQKIRLTIKELGDFTSKISEIETGTTAFIEGPYGNFTLSEGENAHNIIIAGGIGITPAISMLETLHHRKDSREVTLIYGSPSKSVTAFYDDLNELSEKLNFNLVYVFEDAPKGWEGETGFIDEDILRRHIPEEYENCEFFICGPPPMMDIVESTLNEWGIPVHKIQSERFNIA